MITAATLSTGVVYGFGLCAGFKIFTGAWNGFKSIVRSAANYVADKVMTRYGDRIVEILRAAKKNQVKKLYDRIVAAIVRAFVKVYRKYRYTTAEMGVIEEEMRAEAAGTSGYGVFNGRMAACAV